MKQVKKKGQVGKQTM